jgi:hypothetical protein
VLNVFVLDSNQSTGGTDLNRIALFGAIVALIVLSPVSGDAAKSRHHFRHGIPREAPGQGKSGRLDVRAPEVIP